MRSRDKGARGEREAAKAWAEAVGGTARRGQQFSGGTESPDVVTSFPGIHLEVKRTERGNPYVWMAQAVRDAGTKMPIVLHRRNGEEWLAVVRLRDVARLASEIGPQAAEVGVGPIPASVSGEGVPPAGSENGAAPRVL
mgnify:CR=1 FL=1